MSNCKHLMIGTVVACAISGSAQADLVVFENYDGMFEWELANSDFPETGNWLDITQDASQSGAQVAHGFQAWYQEGFGSKDYWSYGVWGSTQSSVAISDETVTFEDGYGFPETVSRLATYDPGQSVNAGDQWGHSSRSAVFGGWMDYLPLLGDSAVIGVQVELGTGTHFGWIELAWDEDHYNPVRWAYNTTAGEAALVPAPAASLLLCMFAAGEDDRTSPSQPLHRCSRYMHVLRPFIAVCR